MPSDIVGEDVAEGKGGVAGGREVVDVGRECIVIGVDPLVNELGQTEGFDTESGHCQNKEEGKTQVVVLETSDD